MSKGTLTKGVKIIGTGHYVPDRVVTNKELENKVNTSDKWIQDTLGIRERRIVAKGQLTSDLATHASKRAISDAGLIASDIDTIILATATPDRIAPSTATKVQANIGAINASAFDLNAVCSGFIYALTIGSQLVRSGMSSCVLVIGADTFSKIIDWSRRDCVFFGDGAGAAILSESQDEADFISSRLYADGSGYDAFTVPPGEKYFVMDGRQVFNTATKVIPDALNEVLRMSGVTVGEINHVIPHQPSIGILKESARRLGIPFSKVHTNMEKYANTSSATIPLLLSEVNSQGLIAEGDLVALVAVGAGWTWGASLIRW